MEAPNTGSPQRTIAEPPSIRASIRDGAAHAVMLGCGETYLGAFAIFLGATTLQIGILATVPPLVGALFQLFSVRILEYVASRRRALVIGGAINACTWPLIALVPIIAARGSEAGWVLIALGLIFHASAGFMVPIWASLIADLAPSQTRGTFLGKRNKYIGIATFASMLAAGQLLGFFQQHDRSVVGFALIFAGAFVARLLSTYYLSHYEDPAFEIRAEDRFTIVQFLQRSPHSNFARFVFFGATINFSVYIAAPYFSVYMLRDLKLDFFRYTAVLAAAVVAQFIFMQHWGRLSDQVGSKRLLNVCGFGVATVSLVWLFSANFYWLLAIQVYSGLVWSGYNLATQSFIFDAVTPSKLARCAAYHAVINAVFICAGSLVGGVIAERLEQPITFLGGDWKPASPFLLIFLLSSLLRLHSSLVFLPRFQEVRKVRFTRHRDILWEISHLRSVAAATFSVISFLRRGRNGARQRGELSPRA